MEAKAMLDMLRRMRHDVGNHLQVISGYMQLHKYAQAEKYLDKLIKEMAASRIIFQIENAELALYLFKQTLLADDLGMILKYAELGVDDKSILLKNGEPYNSLKKLAGEMENQDDEPEILLSLFPADGGVKMVFQSDRLAKNPSTINIKE